MPEHLKQLNKETMQCLSSDYNNVVTKLLIKHESTFSENDSDLERTEIIIHNSNSERTPTKATIKKIACSHEGRSCKADKRDV